MSDLLHRLMIPSLKLRAYACDTLHTSRDITSAHNTTPNATHALGRTITAGALLSSMLKPASNDTISLKIQGSGPLRQLQVQADAKGNIRAYTARPRVDEESDLGRIDLPKALGAGLLTVTRDLGMKDPYTGTVHLVRGDIAMDTAYYLTESEQTPSAVVIALALDSSAEITASGGILIQTLPDTPESSIILAETKLASPFETLGNWLNEGNEIRDYLTELFDGAEIETLASTELAPRCRCSRERTESMIAALDNDEIHKMIHEDGGAEVNCNFCNATYNFSKEELVRLLEKN